jgi:hypothetical protein
VLEVFPTGGMRWHYRYRLNGRQERVTLGRYPALSLKLARAERDKRQTLVAQGQSPAVQKRLAKQGAAPDTTVAQLGERFFRDVVAKTGGTSRFPVAEDRAAGAGQPRLHDSRPTAHGLHAAARERLAVGRRREGAEPHDRRRARCVQPRRVRAAAARDAAMATT